MLFTDHNRFAKLSLYDPPLPAVVQGCMNGQWLSNHDLIVLDNNLPKAIYDLGLSTDRFFVFDAIYQRRSSNAEVKNPALLRGKPGLGGVLEYNLGELAFWHGASPDGTVSSNSTYYGILDSWNSSFASGLAVSLQTNLNNLLNRLVANPLLAPLDRNDLIRWVVMNALFHCSPGGSLAVNGITLPAQPLPLLLDVPGGNESPIGIGIRRFRAIQAYRAKLSSLGFVLLP